MQVRADRALRSSTSSASLGAPDAVAKSAASRVSLGSYDEFVQGPACRHGSQDGANLDLPTSTARTGASSERRGPLRERMAANGVRAAVHAPHNVEQITAPEKACAMQKHGDARPLQVSRSELLDYKEQAIERERKKLLRKQSAVKVQNCFRRWLRSRAEPALSQAHAPAAPHADFVSDTLASACADEYDHWRGFRVVKSEPHFSSPQLSPISQSERDNRTNQVFDHEAAVQPAFYGGKSPPIVTHANQHYFSGSDSGARSPPIVTQANQQMYRSPSTSSDDWRRTPPDGRRLTPPDDRHLIPPDNRRTASPPIRPLRRESPPLAFPLSQQQHRRLRAVLIGHRVRRRMKLHPVKAIVVKITEAVRLHSEMKQELKEGGAAASAVEIQILRQLEGTREQSVEELAHALTRVEPPVVSSLVSGTAGRLVRKPLREKKFLKKGQGRAAVALGKYKSNEGDVQEGRGAHVPPSPVEPVRDAVEEKGLGRGKIPGGVSGSLGFVVPDSAQDGAGVDRQVERRDSSERRDASKAGDGVGDDGGWFAQDAAPESNAVVPPAACERQRESERERENAPGEMVKPRSRDAKAGGKGASVRDSVAAAMGPKSAGGAHWEEEGGQGSEGGGAESQKAAKPFLKRKTKSVPVSNGPTNWNHVTSKVDAKFKVRCRCSPCRRCCTRSHPCHSTHRVDCLCC